MARNALTPKYIILDETVIKRRGNRIEYLGKFYSTIERRIVTGISLLSSISMDKSKTLFPFVLLFKNKREFDKIVH